MLSLSLHRKPIVMLGIRKAPVVSVLRYHNWQHVLNVTFLHLVLPTYRKKFFSGLIVINFALIASLQSFENRKIIYHI